MTTGLAYLTPSLVLKMLIAAAGGGVIGLDHARVRRALERALHGARPQGVLERCLSEWRVQSATPALPFATLAWLLDTGVIGQAARLRGRPARARFQVNVERLRLARSSLETLEVSDRVALQIAARELIR